MMDQDYQTMMRMTAALNVYDAMQALRGAKGKQIHQAMSGPTGRILAMLKKEDLLGWRKSNGDWRG